MIFHETDLPGVLVVEPERLEDERGFFARTFSREEFGERGLTVEWDHNALAFNHRAGTIRGLHYQRPPLEMCKLVSCLHGSIVDVVVDIRPGSETFMEWFAVRLTEENRRAIYVPTGFAHGYQTLVDGAEVHYYISNVHRKDHEEGVRWDDPGVGIEWPMEVTTISKRDATFPDFDPATNPLLEARRAES